MVEKPLTAAIGVLFILAAYRIGVRVGVELSRRRMTAWLDLQIRFWRIVRDEGGLGPLNALLSLNQPDSARFRSKEECASYVDAYQIARRDLVGRVLEN